MLEIIVDFIDSYQLSRINRFIRKFKIDTIIDVGAHKGDFIKYSLKYFRTNSSLPSSTLKLYAVQYPT